MSRFKSLHREVEKAAAGSIKSLDEVAEDLEYLLTQHLATFRTQGREKQMSAFINEMMQTKDKFKAGATTLEVIRYPEKYISAKFFVDLFATMLRSDTGRYTICSAVFFISAPITPNVE